ncbi:S9 family peptidase [Sporosalibacterium faouarense]|uniref:S9 family peptidase n=1 Tax=Sporosalibacterium faouarense TaxID=516123 RepID=UPI001A9C500C|nr:S9 family peptidase [Sporosalibacterium faouarense]
MDKERYLTIEEVVSIPLFTQLNISDDGESVAFVKQTPDWKENKYRNHIWIYEKNKEKTYPLTSGDNESSSPIWSADFNKLAYLAKVGDKEKGKNQIFIKDRDGYIGIQVTNEKEGVNSFKWAPNNKGFYYITKSSKEKDIEDRNEFYGDFTHVDKEYHQNCICYIDLKDGISKIKEAKNTFKKVKSNHEESSKENDDHREELFGQKLIGERDFFIKNFDISPMEDKIIYSIAPSSDMKDLDEIEIYIYDIETGDSDAIEVDAVLGSKVLFSPCGEKICYLRSRREKDYYKNNITDSLLEILDLNSKETSHPLNGIDIDITLIQWIDKGILINWQERTNYLIGLVDTDGRIEIIEDRDDCLAWEPTITKSGDNIAYTKANSKEIFEVYLDGKKVTSENELLSGKAISSKEVISWESSDGLEVEGVLSLPSNYDASKKYPLLLVVHGGPTWASFPIPAFNKYYPIEEFVEKGFIVLEPNYRGSSGYGDEFKKANYRNLGLGDYDDIISGVDILIKKGMVDKEKVGIMGWSQGGYISAFCSTYSDRFKAISVGAGISNWITYYVNTDIHQFTRQYLGENPWIDKEIYEKTSPMTYIKSACTPTLIQHGEKDARVPTPNAYELYQGLQDVGVDTELVIFKGMGHGSDKPGFNRAIMKQNLIWFCHHILGESIDDFRKL